jgi:hypothetical protein
MIDGCLLMEKQYGRNHERPSEKLAADQERG